MSPGISTGRHVRLHFTLGEVVAEWSVGGCGEARGMGVTYTPTIFKCISLSGRLTE